MWKLWYYLQVRKLWGSVGECEGQKSYYNGQNQIVVLIHNENFTVKRQQKHLISQKGI